MPRERSDIVLGGPAPATRVSQLAERGRDVVLRFPAETEWNEILFAAAGLRKLLGSGFSVIATPPRADDPQPVIRAIRLVDAAAVRERREAVDTLVHDFRALAADLVRQAEAKGYPEQVGDWLADPHDPHCRFEHDETGVVVEANVHDATLLDAGFLLIYAETSGSHPAVLDLCVAGYHDMVRVLKLSGYAV